MFIFCLPSPVVTDTARPAALLRPPPTPRYPGPTVNESGRHSTHSAGGGVSNAACLAVELYSPRGGKGTSFSRL